MINLNDARDDPVDVVGGAIEKICLVPRSDQPRFTTEAWNVLTGKSLDLFANNVNSSVVTGIEFQHHLSHVLGPVYPSRKG